jgi:hypothetical protein
MLDKYILGMYYPGKGYFHKCAFPKCDDPYFFGRKNQLYHPECKKRMDAEKVAEKREKTKEENKIMEHNLKILEDFYPSSLGTVEIPSKELGFKGFDFNASARRIKTEKYGYVCYVVHGFAFRYIQKHGTIIIYKKDELHRI